MPFWTDRRFIDSKDDEGILGLMIQDNNSEITSGITSYGYDLTLANETQESLQGLKVRAVHVIGNIIIPKLGHKLCLTNEYIKIPRNCIGFLYLKSTYSRKGVILSTSPLEPEWEGRATLSLANLSDDKVELVVGKGVVQLMIYENDEECQISYRDKKGGFNYASSILTTKRRV